MHGWGKVPTHEAAEYQVQCWEQEESHMGSYLYGHAAAWSPQNSGCTVILPLVLLPLFWHCNSSWPFRSIIISGLPGLGHRHVLLDWAPGNNSDFVQGLICKILSYGRIFLQIFILLWYRSGWTFPQASHLCHNYVKTHHAIHVHLGKLMKRIKTVTMGLILCAKHSDITVRDAEAFTPPEPDTRNINSK